MERIDMEGLIDELRRIERLIDTSTTDEGRVFMYMRLVNCAQLLGQEAGQAVQDLSGKCIDRLDPVIKGVE
jgi:hypothetical protein